MIWVVWSRMELARESIEGANRAIMKACVMVIQCYMDRSGKWFSSQNPSLLPTSSHITHAGGKGILDK